MGNCLWPARISTDAPRAHALPELSGHLWPQVQQSAPSSPAHTPGGHSIRDADPELWRTLASLRQVVICGWLSNADVNAVASLCRATWDDLDMMRSAHAARRKQRPLWRASTRLQGAARAGNLPRVTQLLDARESDINAADRFFCTAAIAAASAGHLAVEAYLVGQDATRKPDMTERWLNSDTMRRCVTSATALHDGRVVFGSNSNGDSPSRCPVWTWDPSTSHFDYAPYGSPGSSYGGSHGRVSALATVPATACADGAARIVAGRRDATLMIINLATRRVEHESAIHYGCIRCLAVTTAGLLVSSCVDRGIYASLIQHVPSRGRNGRPARPPGTDRVAGIRVWQFIPSTDENDGGATTLVLSPLAFFAVETASGTTPNFSALPDGRVAFTFSTDGFVRLWDVGSDPDTMALLPFETSKYIISIAILRCGTLLAAAVRDSYAREGPGVAVYIWDLSVAPGVVGVEGTAQLPLPALPEIDARSGSVDLCVLPDGRFLVSTLLTMRIWEHAAIVARVAATTALRKSDLRPSPASHPLSPQAWETTEAFHWPTAREYYASAMEAAKFSATLLPPSYEWRPAGVVRREFVDVKPPCGVEFCFVLPDGRLLVAPGWGDVVVQA